MEETVSAPVAPDVSMRSAWLLVQARAGEESPELVAKVQTAGEAEQIAYWP